MQHILASTLNAQALVQSAIIQSLDLSLRLGLSKPHASWQSTASPFLASGTWRSADLHTGGKLAKDKAAGSSSEEETEWHDAQEELSSEAMPAADQTWWEQAGPDDVEQHLLKDIHEKGMHTLMLRCLTCFLFVTAEYCKMSSLSRSCTSRSNIT